MKVNNYIILIIYVNNTITKLEINSAIFATITHNNINIYNNNKLIILIKTRKILIKQKLILIKIIFLLIWI